MSNGPATIIMCIALLSLGLQLTAAVIPSDSHYWQSLDGAWRFKLGRMPGAPAEPFYTPDYREDITWNDLGVPGNWEMAGFSPATYVNPDNSSGLYRTWIAVPADWKGRQVQINFDGVQNGAEIWLNGKPVEVSEPAWGRANYHESGWTAWQADLTPQVRFGEKNLLAMRVTKNTKSSDLDTGDYFFLGGIHRTVTLFSVPKAHIDDLTVQTFLKDDNAEVKTIVEVAGEGKVSVKLGKEKPVEAAVSGGKVEFSQIVSKPKLWSAEHPNLYPLTVELKDSSGKTIEKLEKR
ncbi:MAG TPA: hypothetical protein VFI02_19950, partial [Armatimonadota bacterium]|nr:hypothetical protein [Armatimonadota bacterium]